MTETTFGSTELAVTQRDEISSLLQSYLVQEAKLLPLVTDVSRYAVKGNKSVSFPRYGTALDVKDKSEYTLVDDQTITYVDDQLDFNLHKYISWVIEKRADKQSVINTLQDMVMRVSKDLALQVDKDIITQLALASAAAPDHQISFAGATIVKSDILAARKLLLDQHLPANELYIGIGNSREAEMLELDNFIDASKYGSAAPIQNAEFGRIYGMPVIRHTEFGDNMYMWHKSAVAFAFQIGAEFDSQKDLKNLGTRYSVDQLYGVKVLDAGVRNVVTS